MSCCSSLYRGWLANRQLFKIFKNFSNTSLCQIVGRCLRTSRPFLVAFQSSCFATLTLNPVERIASRPPTTRFHQHPSSYITTAHDTKLRRADYCHQYRFFQELNALGTCTNVQNACNPNLNATYWQQRTHLKPTPTSSANPIRPRHSRNPGQPKLDPPTGAWHQPTCRETGFPALRCKRASHQHRVAETRPPLRRKTPETHGRSEEAASSNRSSPES